MLIKIISLIKSLILAVIFFLFSPFLIFLPKYEAYIFVLTTGRSGSGTLASLMKNSSLVNANHEPYPILNNSFHLTQNVLSLWIGFQYYFVKYPIILLSRGRGEKYYLETNHLYLKYFSGKAKRVFGKKIKVIHLKRPAHLVAKSIYEIGKTPGSKYGNKWYLNPYSKNNLLDFDKCFYNLEDEEKESFLNLYQCIWYWFEMESRIDVYKQQQHGFKIMTIETSQLNNSDELRTNINNQLGIHINTVQNSTKIDNNLKLDEKIFSIDIEIVKEKVMLFQNVKEVNHDR